jgi:fumarate reductase subunit C
VKAEDRRRYPVYVPKSPRTWWLRTGPNRRFAAREITSMFSAASSLMILLYLFALSRGRGAYDGFLRWLDHGWVVAIFVVILLAVLYHTATWFRLTTKILVIRITGRPVPPRVIGAALVAALIGASALIAYFHIWF